ncbi:MAG TPA: cobyric acid synthase [Acidimicrobiales bacterium]|jgi:adenosylcobyric acid synthase|nr:cobyric acid synthase [Acidimicrobiales bacterium]
MSGLMVCGTGSDSGKSTVVTGLCRLLAREGWRVAPFKAQNMANNSAVTAGGHEIGRAQYAQAEAARAEPEVAMNPVLLKPTGPRSSQVVVMGRPWATLDAARYQDAKPDLWPVVVNALGDLRTRFDAVICEGAGSPAEINLLERDITNLRVAREAGFPAILVGDIDRGGVFAALFGTVALLPADLSSLIRGFVINKFRGDPSLLTPGFAQLEQRTGVATLGVLPWFDDAGLDAEDSMALERYGRTSDADRATLLDIAAIRFPRISNFTDLDALALEPGVCLRLVGRPGDLGRPDLIILPGTKSTVADLRWLRRTGLADAIASAAGRIPILGICGGYQMLGRRIVDAVESADPAAEAGLGLLPTNTTFMVEKTVRRVGGRSLGHQVDGYEIHHGITRPVAPWLELADGPEGAQVMDGGVRGTSVHGLFENDGFRRAYLGQVADRAGSSWTPGEMFSFRSAREDRYDRLADLMADHLDVPAILALLKGSG